MSTEEKKMDVLVDFLIKTKSGTYVEIDKSIVEIPRALFSRDEFVFGKQQKLFYSMSTHV